MTPSERKSLAESLLCNPLWPVLMAEQEATAIERMIAANTEQTRHECQLRVQAVRSFRQDCEASARNNPHQKGAVV